MRAQASPPPDGPEATCSPRRARITGLLESKAPVPRLWVAEQVGTRVRMPLGAKSRRRRRPSADAGGPSHPRAFAPGAQPFAGACFSFSRANRIQQPPPQPVAPARTLPPPPPPPPPPDSTFPTYPTIPHPTPQPPHVA